MDSSRAGLGLIGIIRPYALNLMTTVAAFHFEDKRIETPSPDGIAAAIAAGAYCWIDIERPADAPDVLGPLDVDPVALKRVQRSTPFGDFVLGRHCIHCALIETLFYGRRAEIEHRARGFGRRLYRDHSRRAVRTAGPDARQL